MAKGDSFGFVATNLVANLIFIARSYVTMHALDYRDLGVVTVMQTIMLLVGALQFGVLNGGYRLLCSVAAEEEGRLINNAAYSCFAVIATFSLLVGLSIDRFGAPDVAIWVTLTGIGAGALTLVRNWINNQMIAGAMLRLLNRVTMWSAIMSLVPLLAIGRAPLAACILSVAIQPALFIGAVLVARPALRPDGWNLDSVLLRRIFSAGFFIFLSGMLLQLNAQVERWYVVRFLGLDALGHLYLAFLLVNLFSIVPNALQSLFMPRIVQAWDRRDAAAIGRAMRRLVLGNLAYCATGILAVALFARPIVELALPRYGGDLRYVFLVLPGLAIYTIGGAVGVIFNVLIRYRTYNVGFGAATLLTIVAFAAGPLFAIRYTLDGVSLIKASAYGLSGLIFIVGFWLLSREYGEFRLGWRGGTGRA